MFLLLSFDSEQEHDKFDFIFQKYKRLMLHKAYEILHDYHLAEDAASEAFIRIYKNIHKVGDPTDKQSIAFFVTIVKNVSLTMLKKIRNQQVEEYDEELPDDFNLEEQTISNINSELFYQIINQLGEEMKGVFLLRYAHDLSHKEIGKILHISENNVTVRLHRAKKKIAALLAEARYQQGGGYAGA